MHDHHRIAPERASLAVAQVTYLADVAETAVSLGDPTTTDSILYAFAVTEVPFGIDATTEPTGMEIVAVRALVMAAFEITRAA